MRTGVTPGAGPGPGWGGVGITRPSGLAGAVLALPRHTPGAGPQVWLAWCWHYQALGLAGAVVAGPLRLGRSPLVAPWSCESSLPLASLGWAVGSGLLSGETASGSCVAPSGGASCVGPPQRCPQGAPSAGVDERSVRGGAVPLSSCVCPGAGHGVGALPWLSGAVAHVRSRGWISLSLLEVVNHLPSIILQT